MFQQLVMSQCHVLGTSSLRTLLSLMGWGWIQGKTEISKTLPGPALKNLAGEKDSFPF